jgi:GDPmannose 4,6-dehydratase
MAAAAIAAGARECLYVGNLNARRDWGYAPDYVRAMWMMLQHPAPDDYVVATGENHTVREFVEKAFAALDMPLRWEGSGDREVGVNEQSGKPVVRIDPRYYRPTEVETLLGDAGKIRRALGWRPEVSFDQLVRLMAAADRDRARASGDAS